MQGFVGLCTRESDLNIKYGSHDYGAERSEARSSVKYLLSDVNNIRQSYIRLGFHLKEFNAYKYYRDFGYDSLAEFCDVNLGMDKSAVSRCIAVYERFSARGKHYSASCSSCTDYGHSSMFLDEKYSDFSYSQLCEMVSIKDTKLLSSIKPDMTIKQIREIKSRNCVAPLSDTNVSQPDVNVSQVATSQQAIKLFDYDTYARLNGAAKSSYIKSLDTIGNSILVNIFDSNGAINSDFFGIWFDVFFIDEQNNTLYLRSRSSDNVLRTDDN